MVTLVQVAICIFAIASLGVTLYTGKQIAISGAQIKTQEELILDKKNNTNGGSRNRSNSRKYSKRRSTNRRSTKKKTRKNIKQKTKRINNRSKLN
jgi:hypothetical protein